MIASEHIAAAVARVGNCELALLLELLCGSRHERIFRSSRSRYLEVLRREDVSPAAKVAAGLIHHHVAARMASADPEQEHATRATIENIIRTALVDSRADASIAKAGVDLVPDLSDGDFVQLLHETLLGRGCQGREFLRWQFRLESRELRRSDVVSILTEEARRVAARDAERQQDDGHTFYVMGTGERVTLSDWQARARERGIAIATDRSLVREHPPAADGTRGRSSRPRPLVSAITSLYAGGRHIERFLANMTSQAGFADLAELVIIDAASPDGEQAVIERYRQHWPNVRYFRTPSRIGIYEAWNMAIEVAQGEYLTSANVDDLRRQDSLMCQAELLDALPFVDVVYQDFLYTLEPDLTYEQVATMGYRSELPIVTPQGLMALNPPHNAPMWRRSLHDELGGFDPGLQSAGDYDFWMRCVIAGKVFWKQNDPHIVYYQNPHGLSTRPDTRGHEETREVHRRYGRQLLSPNLVMPIARWRATLGLDTTVMPFATSMDRVALAHEALLACAKASWAAAPPAAPAQDEVDAAPLRLLIDGPPATAGRVETALWHALAATWARMPGVEVNWLDRGAGAAPPGAIGIPFPRHRQGAGPADSMLIQRVCDHRRIDVFLSAQATTPTATPTVALFQMGTRPSGGTSTREGELALAFARQVVCSSAAAATFIQQQQPGRAAAAITATVADAQPQVLARALLDAAREVRRQSRAGALASFLAGWRGLRELQASVTT